MYDNLSIRRISSTYTTFKVDIPASVLGIGPRSLLSLRRLGEKREGYIQMKC